MTLIVHQTTTTCRLRFQHTPESAPPFASVSCLSLQLHTVLHPQEPYPRCHVPENDRSVAASVLTSSIFHHFPPLSVHSQGIAKSRTHVRERVEAILYPVASNYATHRFMPTQNQALQLNHVESRTHGFQDSNTTSHQCDEFLLNQQTLHLHVTFKTPVPHLRCISPNRGKSPRKVSVPSRLSCFGRNLLQALLNLSTKPCLMKTPS